MVYGIRYKGHNKGRQGMRLQEREGMGMHEIRLQG
jgi:hypothetical protein